MLTLMIKQTLPNGVKKNWKLRSGQKVQTFGASRLADLISIDPLSKGMQGAFEYRSPHWYYINLDRALTLKDPHPEIKITKDTQIALGGSILSFELAEKNADLFEKLSEFSPSADNQQKKSYSLYIVRYRGTVVETKVLPRDQKFVPQMTENKDLDISSREVSLGEVSHLMKMSKDQILDHESKKGAYIVLAASFILLGLSLLAPKKTEIIALPKEIRSSKVIVLNDLKKKKGLGIEKKNIEKQIGAKPTPPEVNKAQESGGAGKVAGILKSLNGGKLSQILGKVSAQAAKSSNVMVNPGVAAGTAPSGRALAAIGPLDKSGKDWNKDANGKGVVISTKGKGGGGSTSGLGTLKGGVTGQGGGVGLIEDESEVTGGLDRELIAQYIKTQLGQILYCYERQLSANPDLEGKIAVRFTIGSTGQVVSQKIGDTTLKNATVEGCILNRVALWKFPAPQGGTSVVVTYPFLFKSTN